MPVHKKQFDREQTFAVLWESDDSGNAEINLGWTQGGTAHQIVSIPGTGVTDNFDVSVSALIQMAEGSTAFYADILNGEGADLDNGTGGETKNLSKPFTLPFQAELVFRLSGAGAKKTGVFFLQLWDEHN